MADGCSQLDCGHHDADDLRAALHEARGHVGTFGFGIAAGTVEVGIALGRGHAHLGTVHGRAIIAGHAHAGRDHRWHARPCRCERRNGEREGDQDREDGAKAVQVSVPPKVNVS